MAEERNKKSHTGGMARFLVCSIVFNIFLVGMMLGLLARGWHGPVLKRPGPGYEQMVEKFYEILPEQEAQKMSNLLQVQAGVFETHRMFMRKQIEELVSIMRKEDANPQMLASVFDGVLQSEKRLSKTMQATMRRVLTELSFESRVKVVEELEREFLRLPPPPLPPPPHLRPKRHKPEMEGGSRRPLPPPLDGYEYP